MGGTSSKAREQEEIDQLLESALGGGKKPEWANEDSLRSPKALAGSLKAAGVESSNLICAIDFTASNKTAGADTFGGLSLHTLDHPGGNPYESALSIIGKTLSSFDDDNLIPAFGFGDQTSKSFGTRPLGEAPCRGFEGVLSEYRKALQRGIVLSGPTSFAPVIRKAIDLVKASGNELHVLLIIADGQVSEALDCKRETINAIVEASRVPLSIVIVGVGDGPFDQMAAFDDQLPERRFDNLQFVDFQPFQAALAAEPSKEKQTAIEAAFALCALQELPSQFKEIVHLGLLGDGRQGRLRSAEASRGSGSGSASGSGTGISSRKASGSGRASGSARSGAARSCSLGGGSARGDGGGGRLRARRAAPARDVNVSEIGPPEGVAETWSVARRSDSCIRVCFFLLF